MKPITSVVILLLLGLSCLSAEAQRRRDPLTEAEADQIRMASDEAPKRIGLIAGFATVRLATIEQIRSNPNLQEDKGAQIHDLLEDFTSIVDELDDNVEMYDERNEDLRKALKNLIETNTDWQLRLRTLRQTSGNDLKPYEFALQNAEDSVAESAKSSRATLEDQNIKFSKSKDKGKKQSKDDQQ
jgi:hypothetical protein